MARRTETKNRSRSGGKASGKAASRRSSAKSAKKPAAKAKKAKKAKKAVAVKPDASKPKLRVSRPLIEEEIHDTRPPAELPIPVSTFFF